MYFSKVLGPSKRWLFGLGISSNHPTGCSIHETYPTRISWKIWTSSLTPSVRRPSALGLNEDLGGKNSESAPGFFRGDFSARCQCQNLIKINMTCDRYESYQKKPMFLILLMEEFFAPVEVGSLSHYLQSFYKSPVVVGDGISEPSTVPMPKILEKPPHIMRPRSVVVVLSPELLKRMWCSLAKLLNGDRIARGKWWGPLWCYSLDCIQDMDV